MYNISIKCSIVTTTQADLRYAVYNMMWLNIARWSNCGLLKVICLVKPLYIFHDMISAYELIVRIMLLMSIIQILFRTTILTTQTVVFMKHVLGWWVKRLNVLVISPTDLVVWDRQFHHQTGNITRVVCVCLPPHSTRWRHRCLVSGFYDTRSHATKSVAEIKRSSEHIYHVMFSCESTNCMNL